MLSQFLTGAVIRVECALGTPEIIGIALIVLLLFGGRKIPELMRGLGKGVKSFKDGMNGLGDEEKPAPGAGKENERG
ncbi:MAG: twin-arginine translocase TatA/TatE family subunit [Odoribacteraceae bacterium]|nr:twin-arginine translocase TatA/TatE family subunit [Odoribacteraceae bacterium]